jgi:hypothetical protein
MNKWFFLGFAIFCFGLSFFVPLGVGLILIPISTGMVGYLVGTLVSQQSDRRSAGNKKAGAPPNLR